jgi:6,7-dimethyl-8-ribityllumazine synthase
MGAPGAEKPDAEDLDGSELRVAVVASRYNQDIVRRLVRGAQGALAEHGCEDPIMLWVPGALELPLAALTLAESGNVDAIVVLGCVINGETAHFQFVAAECASGISHVNLDTGVPCAFGVLTTYDREQALARSGPKHNKGAEAVETALEMANLIRRLQEGDGGQEGDGEEQPLIQIGSLPDRPTED